MSNNPTLCTSDAEQAEINRAEDALDFIDALPAKIDMMLLVGAINHNLDVTKAATGEVMDIIREALSDYYHKDRLHLMQVAGWRKDPETEFQTIQPLPNAAMSGFSPRQEAARAMEE